MAGKKGQKKRFWSDEEKRSICDQARVSGVSVAQVARRYALNTNLIHKWLRDSRFSSDDEGEVQGETAFLPVEIEGTLSAPAMLMGVPALNEPVLVHRIDITLSDGRRILVEGPTGLPAVQALVEGLMA